MNDKRVSCSYILNSLMTEFGFKNLNSSDIFDYIGDCIQLIGHGLHQEVQYHQTNIEFYRIHYPCNMTQFLNVYYNGKIVARKSCKRNHENRPFGWIESAIVDDVKLIQVRDSITALEDQSQEEVEARELLLQDIIKSFDFVHKYKKVQVDNSNWVNPTENLIETSIEQGTVYIEYQTIAVDEDGIPLLFDEIKYLNAIKYYCAFILIQSGIKHPVISYGDALALYKDWIGQAKNEAKKLTPLQAHEFKTNWTNVLRGSSGKYKYRN